MKIFIASDHAGFKLKESLIPLLLELDYEVVDKGAFSYDEMDDYPDFIRPVAEAVSQHPMHTLGIIIGGSGQGEAILANRFKNVRATVYYGGSEEVIKLSREHNDANILSLGSRFLTDDEAKRAVKLWLDTDFSEDERHIRRIQKIDD
ncbi:ribose-5-phosphate isomerase [Candidatus Campbellbacteria bacterium CG22_combo_CG10-13_8_21_14_all_36_13]|uniref:Ribose-5-phosphate isomerase n=1 Tax=Candidatus Campbellbacteria bacterium CG22_combo_CG10-13_8_21_14_all_36_13 TaxID=1974529 RepID=A0A2H0DZ58_9BACT|nr:MAG: ribose-5-phosphate isomerase [Candidatus Campbellbacteria bacterium CG22_combo_CG10-13_8_21_14_all_36_13]